MYTVDLTVRKPCDKEWESGSPKFLLEIPHWFKKCPESGGGAGSGKHENVIKQALLAPIWTRIGFLHSLSRRIRWWHSRGLILDKACQELSPGNVTFGFFAKNDIGYTNSRPNWRQESLFYDILMFSTPRSPIQTLGIFSNYKEFSQGISENQTLIPYRKVPLL